MTLPLGVTLRYAALDQAVGLRAEPVEQWLGSEERGELDRLRDQGRRHQWLAGRAVAKQLIAEELGIGSLADVQILTRDPRGQGVRPRILHRRHELRASLSISHTDLGVLVALAKTAWISLGVDLAPLELPVDDGFQRLWFTAFERQWIEHDPKKRAAIVWALKEAIYKAANDGQPWNPRQVELRARGRNEFECSHRGRPLVGLSIAMHQYDGQLGAVACLRRATGTSRADSSSTPRPASVGPREVFRPGQSPRFIQRVG